MAVIRLFGYHTIIVMNDSITQVTDTLRKSASTVIPGTETNSWEMISLALIVALIIVAITIVITKRHKTHKNNIPINNLRKQVNQDGDIDFGNIMNSAFLSKALYDELKVKCHPDRFVSDPIKQQLADDLFQRVTQNKVNYKVLLELKKKAEETLNI